MGWEAGALLLGAGVLALVLGCRWWTRRQRRAAVREELAEQSAVEEALRVSEAHYRGLFEATSDGLIVVTEAGLVLDVNPAAEKLMHAAQGEMLGRALDEYVDANADPPQALRSDGTTAPIAFTRVPFGSGQELVTITDLDELLALRSRLSHAERLEAIARLAGGVAHDFNNLLTALRANADVLRQEVRTLPDPTVALDCVDGIVDAAERGVTVTGQLLAFGRRQVLRPEVLDPAQFLRRSAPLYRAVLHGNLELVLDIPEVPSGWGIHVDSTKLETSVMNLVINAADAMPRGGTVRLGVHQRDGEIVIAVQDEGEGVPDDVLPHIFEPFYTTKHGLGSGLGLPSVHGFVAQSGGRVEVRNVEGRGARVEMSLPLVDPPPFEPPAESEPPARVEGRGEERILLIDDDDQVRRTVQRMLRSAGYDVHSVSRGTDGLEYLEDNPVDLLITDVMMPGLSGIEVAERVSPDLPVIFISGYSERVVDVDRGRFLAKPFVPSELLAIVREVLDDRDG